MEILGTWGLKVNFVLVVTQQSWGWWTLSIKRGHKVLFLSHSVLFTSHWFKNLTPIFLPTLLCNTSIEDFFPVRVFFHRHWRFTRQQGKRGYHPFLSTTSSRSRTFNYQFASFHVRWLSRIFVFLIGSLVIARLPLDEIYHLGELPFDWLMITMEYQFLFTWWFCYSNLTKETDVFELTWIITLVLQANRLIKYASHSKEFVNGPSRLKILWMSSRSI